MSTGAWWTLAFVGILAALWWWAEVYMPRVHMRQAIREVRESYRTPAEIEQLKAAYRAAQPVRPQPPPNRFFSEFAIPPLPPSHLPAYERELVHGQWHKDGHITRDDFDALCAWQKPICDAWAASLRPSMPPRKCRFKRGRKV